MSQQYDLYLKKHKENVKRGFEWIRVNLSHLVDDHDTLEWLTDFAHDASKTNSNEYDAYDAYFYGGNRSFQVVQNFRKAFLFHIHQNPHHWQYWVLLHDDPNEPQECIEMPYCYAIEMICDWWSFSWAKGNLFEVFEWWDIHKKHIKLHEKTYQLVEEILEEIRKKLLEDGNHVAS